VYENAGYGTFYGNADDLYNNYCHSNDLGRLKVGMIIAVSTHTKSYLGGIYGHVGIYIGDGWVMDNIGNIRKIAVQNWMDYYGTTVSPKWGWLGNINIA
jgi:cell wall-associated NlpC family hydrolase